MKHLEKMLTKAPKGDMSKDEIQAKLDVLVEMMDMLEDETGSSVKSGMDEMMKPKESKESSSVEEKDSMPIKGGNNVGPLVKANAAEPEVADSDNGGEGMKEAVSENEADEYCGLDDQADHDSIFSQKKTKKKKFSFLED